VLLGQGPGFVFGIAGLQGRLLSQDAPDEDEEPEDGSRADDSQWFAGE
jgi:hypothetical protein